MTLTMSKSSADSRLADICLNASSSVEGEEPITMATDNCMCVEGCGCVFTTVSHQERESECVSVCVCL